MSVSTYLSTTGGSSNSRHDRWRKTFDTNTTFSILINHFGATENLDHPRLQEPNSTELKFREMAAFIIQGKEMSLLRTASIETIQPDSWNFLLSHDWAIFKFFVRHKHSTATCKQENILKHKWIPSCGSLDLASLDRKLWLRMMMSLLA